SDPVVDLSLTQTFSEKQQLSLIYSRQNNVSVQYSRETYVADIIGLNFTQFIGEKRKWEAAVSGTYSMYEYQQTGGAANVTNTQYDSFQGPVSLAYHLKRWLTASLGYAHEFVMGNSSSVIDYDVNRVTLRLAVGY